MQLYNTLSAEERAIMIDDAGKQRLTLSSMLMRKFRSTQFRNDLFRAWDPLVVLGRMWPKKEYASYRFLQIILCF
jgi:UPF0176 protein